MGCKRCDCDHPAQGGPSKQDQLVMDILTTADREIDEYQIDVACLQRLKHLAGQHGKTGDTAIDLLAIVKNLLNL